MPDTTVHVDGPDNPGPPSSGRTGHIGKLGAGSAALYINRAEQPLFVEIKQGLTLGRQVPGSNQLRLLDLTAYEGQEKGVSRVHALLRPLPEGGLGIEDVGSSNGTAVNNSRLLPHTPHRLKSGDLIMIGALEIEIYFEPQPVSTTPTGSLESSGSKSEGNATNYLGEEGDTEDPVPALQLEAPKSARLSTYKATVSLNPQSPSRDMAAIEQVIRLLKASNVRLTLQIEANDANGFDEATVRALEEASRALKFSESRFRSS
jgi:pSer/pThr/pTyr-binding forkhead associated (FHA) protein